MIRSERNRQVNEETDMKNAILKFLRDEEGLTTVEYAVAGGLIAAAVVLAFTALGTEVGNVIEGITAALTGG